MAIWKARFLQEKQHAENKIPCKDKGIKWRYFIIKRDFMFCGPCISIHLCNKNQLDAALYNLSLFRQSASACFGHICSPSSGGILCLKHNAYQLQYIYSIPPDDGLQTCPKHVKADWRNDLRINSAASSWLLLHGWRNRCKLTLWRLTTHIGVVSHR